MDEVKLCCECGNEIPKTGTVKNYCSAKCYQKAYRESKKKQAKEFSVAVEEFVSEGTEPKEELLGMVETKQKAKADELWSAVRLLHNQKMNIAQLITSSEEGLKKAETELSDCQHKMFLLDLTDSELLALSKQQREILSRRSGFKNLLAIFQMLERLNFEPEVTQAINYGKSYKLKTEEGSFSYGDVYSEFLEKQKLLMEAKIKVEEEKVKEDESLKEIKTYIEELHESPITGRMGTTISFAKNPLSDLKTKVQQLSTKSKAVRVDLGRSTITTYN